MIEPIKIEAYTCPVCEDVLYMDLEEARKKVNIHQDTPLPTGFIYRDLKFDSIRIVRDILCLTQHNSEFPHSYDHTAYSFRGGTLEGTNKVVNSREVKENLKKKQARLLTEKEVLDFQKISSFRDLSSIMPRLIRITSELENLV